MALLRPKKKHMLNVFGKEPETLDEVAQCVIAMVNSEAKKDNNNRVVGFSWNIASSINVSNSHSAPEGHLTNWGRNEKDKNGTPLPTGHPGWEGRVWIRFEKPHTSFPSRDFSSSLTHPGTGGFGSYDGPWTRISSIRYQNLRRIFHDEFTWEEIHCYSWDYRFFDMDWPLIEEMNSKERVWDSLQGNLVKVHRHQFLWNDPLTVAYDNEMVKYVTELQMNNGI